MQGKHILIGVTGGIAAYNKAYLIRELVKRGAAWVYEDYIKDKKKLAHFQKLQAEAKRKKIGLWNSPRPIKPSHHRQK